MADNIIRQARVCVDFPTYDELTDEQKSFVHFFMENSSFCIRGVYDNNNLLHMAGCIRLNDETNLDTVPMILYTPDNMSDEDDNPFSWDKLVDNGASINKIDNTSLVEERLHFEKYDLIDCNTVLCPAETSLRWYELSTYSDYGYTEEDDYTQYIGYTLATPHEDGIPVKLVLKFEDGNKINIGRNVIPNELSNEDDYISIPIKFAYDGTRCEYQLRTSNFIIKEADSEVQHNLFYKVGILPVGNVSIEAIKSDIINNCTIEVEPESTYKSYSVPDENEEYGHASYLKRVGSSYISILSGLAYSYISNEQHGIPLTSLLSHVNPETEQVDSIIYYRLYKDVNGNAIEVTDYDEIDIRYEHDSEEEDDDEENVSRFFLYTEKTGNIAINDSVVSGYGFDSCIHLAYTDQNLNGGNVPITDNSVDEQRIFYLTLNGINEQNQTTLFGRGLYYIYNEDGSKVDNDSVTFKLNSDDHTRVLMLNYNNLQNEYDFRSWGYSPLEHEIVNSDYTKLHDVSGSSMYPSFNYKDAWAVATKVTLSLNDEGEIAHNDQDD